jgi:hypothetical protein
MVIWNPLLKLLRDIVPCLSKFSREGILESNAIRWCTLPLDTYSDKDVIPDGIMDITHPSIVYIPNKWNGYSHWLAATPYPQTVENSRMGAIFENTCIFYSNHNGSSHPNIFLPIAKNPIITKQEAGYNSDPELYFDSDDGLLYCITRKRCGPDYITRLVIQSSKDGESWSEPIQVLTISNNEECLSPCLIKYKGTYRLYVFQAATNAMKTTISVDIWVGSSLQKPDFQFYKKSKWTSNINIWHGGLFEHKNKFYLIGCGTKEGNKLITGQKDITKYLFMGFSEDGDSFTMYSKPILKTNGVYHSSGFIDEKNMFVCYVSLHNRYKGERSYPAGNRIAVFEYPFDDLLNKLS